MKYLFFCVLGLLSFQSFADSVCMSSSCNAPDGYQVEIFKQDELLWSEKISNSKMKSSKKIGSINFVTGINLDNGACTSLFVGSLSYGPMITANFGGNELSVPQEVYEGLCFRVKPSEEIKSPLLSDYRVVVKRY